MSLFTCLKKKVIKIIKYSLGIDVGGTNINAGLVSENGELSYIRSIKTHKEQGYASIIKKISDLIGFYQKQEYPIESVGLALPGSVDFDKGVCVYCPNLKWENIKISQEIKKNTALNVKLINDANAACLGDYYYGAGRNFSNIVYLTLGTGVGSAVIAQDNLLIGKDKAAPEAGHMIINPAGYLCGCGSHGCLETLVSATAINRRFKEKLIKNPSASTLGDMENISTKDIFEAYRRGDTMAIKLIEETKYYLAIGISNLVNIFNPEKVILAGGVMNSHDIILENLVDLVKGDTYPSLRDFSISSSSLGANAGVIGAASFCLKPIKSI